MRSLRRLFALLTLLAAVLWALTACSTEDGGPVEVPAALSVTYTLSGGIDGRTETVEIRSDGTDKATLTAEQRQQLWAIVNNSDFRAVSMPSQEPPCCDMFQYTLETHLQDGSTKTLTWYDTRPTPPKPVSDVVAIVERALS